MAMMGAPIDRKDTSVSLTGVLLSFVGVCIR